MFSVVIATTAVIAPLFPIVLELVSQADMVVYCPYFMIESFLLHTKDVALLFLLCPNEPEPQRPSRSLPIKLKERLSGWEHWCSCRECGFNSQHAHGCSPLSITSPPRDLMTSSGLYGYKHACSTQVFRACNTHVNFSKIDKSSKQKKFGHYDSTIHKQGVGFKSTSSWAQKNFAFKQTVVSSLSTGNLTLLKRGLFPSLSGRLFQWPKASVPSMDSTASDLTVRGSYWAWGHAQLVKCLQPGGPVRFTLSTLKPGCGGLLLQSQCCGELELTG